MRLPAGPVPRVAFVLVRFVKDVEALRRESLRQLLGDEIGGAHAAELRAGGMPVNGNRCCQGLNAPLPQAHNVRS
jgi:hypothetical protein